MELEIHDYILHVSDNHLLLALLLFTLTFLLEDAATTSAALLASSDYLPPSIAFAAIISGIIIGDLALYGMGRMLKRWNWLNSFISVESVKKIQSFMQNRIVFSIIIARFVPGMRLVTYSAMGFFNVNFKIYAITVVLAVGAWTSALFFALYSLGQEFADKFQEHQPIVFVVLFTCGIALPYLIGLIARRKLK